MLVTPAVILSQLEVIIIPEREHRKFIARISQRGEQL